MLCLISWKIAYLLGHNFNKFNITELMEIVEHFITFFLFNILWLMMQRCLFFIIKVLKHRMNNEKYTNSSNKWWIIFKVGVYEGTGCWRNKYVMLMLYNQSFFVLLNWIYMKHNHKHWYWHTSLI